jgi:hypothetical protein
MSGIEGNSIFVSEMYVDLDGEKQSSPIRQDDHLLVRFGDTSKFQSQLPIEDHRHGPIKYWDAVVDAAIARELQFSDRIIPDLFTKEFNGPALVEILTESFGNNLALPFLKLLQEPRFVSDEGRAILIAVELDEDEEVVFNDSLWSWLNDPFVEGGGATHIVAITDKDHPLIIRQKGREMDSFVVATDYYIFPSADEIDSHLENDPNLCRYEQYLRSNPNLGDK